MSVKNLLSTILLGTILYSCSSGNALLNPETAKYYRAPNNFVVNFKTSVGEFSVKIDRVKSPKAVDRFYFLAKNNYYNNNRFFRVVSNFVVQWGITGNPGINKIWDDNGIIDEPVNDSNIRGAIAFARDGVNSRSNQLFINLNDNLRLDTIKYNGVKGFPVFGNVINGMDVVDLIYKEYREQPDQDSIQVKGNEYLQRKFPKLDYIISTEVIE